MAGWPGAYVGREVGESLGNAFTPEGLTRDELIERSFSKPVASPATRATPAPVSLPAAAVSSTAAQLRIPFSSDYCTSKHALIRFAEFIPIGELFQTAEYNLSLR